ncbi:hypothetical protein EON66_01820 [archaeon]|nr:MAG: hypothetical protein EON66_01820 [archaeon]
MQPVGRKAPSSTEAAATNPTASAPAASADDGIVALADDDDEPAAVAPSAKRIRREEEADAEEAAGAGAKPSHTAAAYATGAACVRASADVTVGQPMVAHEGSALVVDDLGEEDVVVLE